MLDPIINFIKSFISGVFAKIAAIKSIFLPPEKDAESGKRSKKRLIGYGIRILIILAILLWFLPLIWNASHIRGFDLAYPKQVIRPTTTIAANEQIEVGGGAQTTRTYDRSMIVDMMIHLINFSVEQNTWMPSSPQYKFGFFGIPYKNTPFLDNKAAFQHGVLQALRRTAVELNDTLGRVRGSSQADKDLQMARGGMQYDDETWWFNPFDERLPFGPVQPSPGRFKAAKKLYESYNNNLENGKSIFDTRSDNLRQYLDRIAKDLGSTVDQLSKRSTASKYDPVTDTFLKGEGNNYGWFDMQADNLFHEALGQVYAYHGLVQAAREDFKDVIETRDLGDIWNRLEAHLAEAAALNPLIVSNGSRDGFLMPAHLATMSESILRARVNMTEIRDVINR